MPYTGTVCACQATFHHTGLWHHLPRGQCRSQVDTPLYNHHHHTMMAHHHATTNHYHYHGQVRYNLPPGGAHYHKWPAPGCQAELMQWWHIWPYWGHFRGHLPGVWQTKTAQPRHGSMVAMCSVPVGIRFWDIWRLLIFFAKCSDFVNSPTYIIRGFYWMRMSWFFFITMSEVFC